MGQTWRARAIMAGTAFLFLSACLDGATGGTGSQNSTHAPASLQVMSSGFTVAGPRGFCVDRGNSTLSENSAFALLGSCSAISGNPKDAKPKMPAILTASVTVADEPMTEALLDQLAAYVSTGEGRETLRRADDAKAVEVLELTRRPGLLLVHARDNMNAQRIQGDYWRGIFSVNAYLVTITVSGFKQSPFDEKTGTELAEAFANAIRRANRAGAPTGAGLTGLIGRLL